MRCEDSLSLKGSRKFPRNKEKWSRSDWLLAHVALTNLWWDFTCQNLWFKFCSIRCYIRDLCFVKTIYFTIRHHSGIRNGAKVQLCNQASWSFLTVSFSDHRGASLQTMHKTQSRQPPRACCHATSTEDKTKTYKKDKTKHTSCAFVCQRVTSWLEVLPRRDPLR